MANENPILSATTILDFFDALNNVYSLNLPITFPQDSPLWTLWSATLQNAEVTANDASTAYTLRGGYIFSPLKVPATIEITVTNLGMVDQSNLLVTHSA